MNAGAIGMAELLLFALEWRYYLLLVVSDGDRKPTPFSSENRPAAGTNDVSSFGYFRSP